MVRLYQEEIYSGHNLNFIYRGTVHTVLHSDLLPRPPNEPGLSEGALNHSSYLHMRVGRLGFVGTLR